MRAPAQWFWLLLLSSLQLRYGCFWFQNLFTSQDWEEMFSAEVPQNFFWCCLLLCGLGFFLFPYLLSYSSRFLCPLLSAANWWSQFCRLLLPTLLWWVSFQWFS